MVEFVRVMKDIAMFEGIKRGGVPEGGLLRGLLRSMVKSRAEHWIDRPEIGALFGCSLFDDMDDPARLLSLKVMLVPWCSHTLGWPPSTPAMCAVIGAGERTGVVLFYARVLLCAAHSIHPLPSGPPGHSKTLRDISAATDILVLPFPVFPVSQIYLGEAFSSYLSVSHQADR